MVIRFKMDLGLQAQQVLMVMVVQQVQLEQVSLLLEMERLLLQLMERERIILRDISDYMNQVLVIAN